MADTIIECSVSGCNKPKKQREWCTMHYSRWRRNGSPHVTKRAAPNLSPPERCTVEGCNNPHKSLGYCIAHYTRFNRYGDVNFKQIASPGEPMAWIFEHMDYEGDDCLKWPYASGGRGDAIVTDNGVMRSGSRVMLEISKGMPDHDSLECAHNCGNGHLGCMNPRHLRWDTRSGNHADKVIHGTDARGEKNARSKLTAGQVLEIRSSASSGNSLARKFGVSGSLISYIRRGKLWGHLSLEGEN